MRLRLLTVALLLTVCSVSARADVKLPAVFGDNMVLQRGMPIPVWGWADPGEQVSVRLGDAAAVTAMADKDGNWRLALDARRVGGPLQMKVEGKNALTFSNVMIGDVWVCSGQSNMQFGVSGVTNAPAEIAAANYPNIRLFTVPRTVAVEPQKDTIGQWAACDPQTVRSFSAVAYFFARDLNKSLDVPIGLIHTSWGGTPAESWTSRQALSANAELAPMLQRTDAAQKDLPQALKDYEEKMKAWETQAYFADPGDKGLGMGFAALDTDAADWKPMDLPGYWETKGLMIDGIVWFRKEVQVWPEWVGKDLTLSLGPIDDGDTTYFNGTQVGAIGLETPNYYQAPRRYTVPGSLVKAGRAVIAVRVYDRWLNGGFAGIPADMTLGPAGPGSVALGSLEGTFRLALAGRWVYKVEVSRPHPEQPIPQPQRPLGAGNPSMPTGLYNAMISPLVPYGIKGAIWYQGEANAGRAYQYRTLFPAMISDWRKAWGEGDFPFLFVQLANFMAVQQQPSENSEWAELREAQTMTLSLPKTGMAVIIDVGEAADIHPKDKQTVGSRLALAARSVAYGQELTYSGPMYDSMKVDGSKAVITFKNVGGGLVAREGETLKGFAICGEDKRFVWADAQISGNQVVVSSAEVPQPVAVRYGWANNPVSNLCNKEGLPACPFRTDEWPGGTANNR